MSETQGKTAKLEKRVNELQAQLDTLAWLHGELSYVIRMAIAKQVAQTQMPVIQEQVEREIANKLAAESFGGFVG